MKRPNILVVGSLAMDLTVSTENFPKKGETVTGINFSTAPGGKGANQAVQAALLGANVTMVGKIGNDDFGKAIIRSLTKSNVDTSNVTISDSAPSGFANIQVQINKDGVDNKIIVVPGANKAIKISDIEFLKQNITNYDIVMLQHEISEEINAFVAKLACEKGVPVMLNPAPAEKIDSLSKYVTFVSPNEHEAEVITGISVCSDNYRKVYDAFHSLGIKNVLITLGKNGSVYMTENETVHSDCVDCGKPVDTTAAGDSYIAAFCTAVSSGEDVESAMRFASIAAGITVSRQGAQTGLPDINAVNKVRESLMK